MFLISPPSVGKMGKPMAVHPEEGHDGPGGQVHGVGHPLHERLRKALQPGPLVASGRVVRGLKSRRGC